MNPSLPAMLKAFEDALFQTARDRALYEAPHQPLEKLSRDAARLRRQINASRPLTDSAGQTPLASVGEATRVLRQRLREINAELSGPPPNRSGERLRLITSLDLTATARLPLEAYPGPAGTLGHFFTVQDGPFDVNIWLTLGQSMTLMRHDEPTPPHQIRLEIAGATPILDYDPVAGSDSNCLKLSIRLENDQQRRWIQVRMDSMTVLMGGKAKTVEGRLFF